MKTTVIGSIVVVFIFALVVYSAVVTTLLITQGGC